MVDRPRIYNSQRYRFLATVLSVIVYPLSVELSSQSGGIWHTEGGKMWQGKERASHPRIYQFQFFNSLIELLISLRYESFT